MRLSVFTSVYSNVVIDVCTFKVYKHPSRTRKGAICFYGNTRSECLQGYLIVRVPEIAALLYKMKKKAKKQQKLSIIISVFAFHSYFLFTSRTRLLTKFLPEGKWQSDGTADSAKSNTLPVGQHPCVL